jgi:hypothetical protein
VVVAVDANGVRSHLALNIADGVDAADIVEDRCPVAVD